MTITNTGNESDRLIGGSTDLARYFEVHEMSMDTGVRKMRSMLNGLEIKLGGYHSVLIGRQNSLSEESDSRWPWSSPRSVKSVSIFTVGGSERKLEAITACWGWAACDEMNDRLARHFGSEKGSAASGGGSMRNTLSVIEISA